MTVIKSPETAPKVEVPAAPDAASKTVTSTKPKAEVKVVAAPKKKAKAKPEATQAPAAKPAAKQATKPVAKKTVSKILDKVVSKAVERATVKVPAKSATAAPAKTKLKLVRDSFTMPKADFDLIDTLKARALNCKRPAKKSELLRAGLHALLALSDAQLLSRLGALSELKPGRPKKSA